MESVLASAFAAAATGNDEAIDLGRAALLVARVAYPDLDVERSIAEIDRLSVVAEERAGGRPAFEAASRVAGFLFDELGFAGNHDDYYDPRNSFLNDVISRRKGIPITLSILLIEVGRRAGIPFQGVGFPGHFIVKVTDGDDERFIDPFNGGRVVTVADLADRLSMATTHARLRHHLAAVTRRQILARLLGNLKFTYLELQEFDRALDVINLLLALTPWDLDQVKDRGLVAYRLGQYQPAYEDLRAYVEYRSDAQDAEWVQKMAQAVRQLAHDQRSI